MRFNANMPMISRQGFMDVCAIEYLRDPDSAHEYLRKAVGEYGVWKELGDMPRSVLPEKSIPKILRKETETPVVELETHSHAESVEARKTRKEDSETLSPDLSEASRQEETPAKDDKVLEQDNNQRETKNSHAPEPIEVGKLVSPITIGSPAMPFQLKGGENKIDALTKGEGFEPFREETTAQEESGPATPTPAINQEAKKEDDAERGEEHSKSREPETKKPSVEDLYGAN